MGYEEVGYLLACEALQPAVVQKVIRGSPRR